MEEKTIEQLIEELAPIVWAERNAERELQKKVGYRPAEAVPWYFLNINHPAIRHMWERYVSEHKIITPASDLERVRFELSTITPEALRGLAKYYKENRNHERRD